MKAITVKPQGTQKPLKAQTNIKDKVRTIVVRCVQALGRLLILVLAYSRLNEIVAHWEVSNAVASIAAGWLLFALIYISLKK